jgi:hypothetical protein
MNPIRYLLDIIGNKNLMCDVIPRGAERNEESPKSWVKSDSIGISRSFVARNDTSSLFPINSIINLDRFIS